MASDIISQYFKKGVDIEISSNDEGFRGSWYAGTVVRPPNDKNKEVLVEYKTLMKSKSSKQRLREELQLVQLRPAPPRENRLSFKFSDEVDGYYFDGWWEGIVTELVGDDKYTVFFRGTREQLNFKASELRLHREWVYGKWVPPLEPANDDESPQNDQNVSLSVELKPKQERIEHKFSPGALVEASSDDEGFEGAWFAATVVKKLNKGKYLIEYHSLKDDDDDDDDDTKLLREEVDGMHIRPCPPEVGLVDRFEVLEQVDALYNDGWWEGVISKVLKDDKYSVYFKATDEVLKFKHSDLRVHQDWINGKWVIASEILGDGAQHLTDSMFWSIDNVKASV